MNILLPYKSTWLVNSSNVLYFITQPMILNWYKYLRLFSAWGWVCNSFKVGRKKAYKKFILCSHNLQCIWFWWICLNHVDQLMNVLVFLTFHLSFALHNLEPNHQLPHLESFHHCVYVHHYMPRIRNALFQQLICFFH